MNPPNNNKERRYGVPASYQVLYNRNYVLGYSYYFRQAKWALEVIDSSKSETTRANNFRPDYRIPERFRADLADYSSTGFDRGHLVSSANQIGNDLQNSETFLLSNMSPQHPKFNRNVWKELEGETRRLNLGKKVLETYVISGPLFFFDQEVFMIGSKNDNRVTLPIPHAFFKSILVETNTGALKMWSFIIPNENIHDAISLDSFQVKTTTIEKISGLYLWESLVGTKIKREKGRIRKLW